MQTWGDKKLDAWEADTQLLQRAWDNVHYQRPGMFQSWADVGWMLLKVATVYLVICGAAANVIWWLT